MIDSHCHLNDPDLQPELDGILARMRQAGVTAALAIGTDVASSRAAMALARQYPGTIAASVGLHPHESAQLDAAMLEELRELARQPEVVAIGEIGLDFHYDFSPRPAQREAFRRQLALAAELELPIIIHEREAVEEAMAILDAEAGWARGGTWHCCSVAPDLAVEIARRLYVSIAGWITFPKAENIRALAQAVPLERLLLETDAPYITPVPYRGKRNEPGYLPYTAHALAAVKGIPLEAVEESTVRNTRWAFPRWAPTLEV